MNNDKSLFFAGVDWGSQSHYACLIDQNGSILKENSFRHSGEGLWNMGNWLIEATDSIPENVAIGIEVTRGPVVESLMARGFDVHSINPKQLDRFRDRFSAAGAKDDRRDAMVLASHFVPTDVTSALWNPSTRISRSCAAFHAEERNLCLNAIAGLTD